MEKILVSKKDEMYSYDEFKVIFSMMQSANNTVCEKLKMLLTSLEEKKTSMGIFFMPQNTFDIFSIFQGDNSICQIELDDILKMIKAVENIQTEYSEEIKNHLNNKLQVLCKYLEEENKVKPVVIQVDNFSYM